MSIKTFGNFSLMYMCKFCCCLWLLYIKAAQKGNFSTLQLWVLCVSMILAHYKSTPVPSSFLSQAILPSISQLERTCTLLRLLVFHTYLMQVQPLSNLITMQLQMTSSSSIATFWCLILHTTKMLPTWFMKQACQLVTNPIQRNQMIINAALQKSAGREG